MKAGDIVYIVHVGKCLGTPAVEATVSYSGRVHFSAGDFTFLRGASNDDFLGKHSCATAYASKEVCEGALEKRDAWRSLRYIVGLGENPPAHMSADEINRLINRIKGNPNEPISG